jgi:ribonuclease-3
MEAYACFATGLWNRAVEYIEGTVRAQDLIGHRFRDPDLVVTALTHSSIAGSRLDSNERLEFLGDAVLGAVVCDELFRRFPDWLEGDLTKVKSMVVSRRVCARIADETGLTDLLILGNGIEGQGALPMSLKAAVYEAVIGAMYLDGGFEAARQFILRTAAHELDTCAESDNHDNHKSTLQQYVQRWMGATPQYEALDEQGPDHSKCFEVCVVINHRRFPGAWGPSKKEAEQEAARRALEILEREPSSTRGGGR